MVGSQIGDVTSLMRVRDRAALIATLLATVATAGAARPGNAPASQARGVPAPVPAGQNVLSDQLDGQSGVVTRLLQWVTLSGDNNGLPFIVIDKLGARIYVFDPRARLLGAAPALIGIARGDDSAPGVGSLRLGKIPLEQRTTPAGRFIARFGPAKGHPPVLWVDYGDAISLHPVVTSNKSERRLQRIKSDEADQHRISFGCINVPAAFYAKTVKPQFKARNSKSIVYILPDTKPLTDVFPGIDVHLPANSLPTGAQTPGGNSP